LNCNLRHYILEGAALALAAVQQLTAAADDPTAADLPLLAPASATANPEEAAGDGAPTADLNAPDATTTATTAATTTTTTNAAKAVLVAPSPLAVLELHERLHGVLADCRCCCGAGGRGTFLRGALPRLTAARRPVAAEAARLKEEEEVGRCRLTLF